MDEIFQAQLRALLRAARHGSLRIMFPFVSGRRRAAGRARSGGPWRPRRCGPRHRGPAGADRRHDRGAVGGADRRPAGRRSRLLRHRHQRPDPGTCLAVDRTDDRVSRLYEPLHPAILRMLRSVARAGRRRSIRVSVCGEMAADPVLLTLLVGLGITEFSMAPTRDPARQAGAARAQRRRCRPGSPPARCAPPPPPTSRRELIEFLAPRTAEPRR